MALYRHLHEPFVVFTEMDGSMVAAEIARRLNPEYFFMGFEERREGGNGFSESTGYLECVIVDKKEVGSLEMPSQEKIKVLVTGWKDYRAGEWAISGLEVTQDLVERVQEAF